MSGRPRGCIVSTVQTTGITLLSLVFLAISPALQPTRVGSGECGRRPLVAERLQAFPGA
jgi:hypothetical protein